MLGAVLDRLIPADEFPGAVDAGGLAYIEGIFRRELALELTRFREALQIWDQAIRADDSSPVADCQKGFAELSPEAQDVWLRRLEHGELVVVSPKLTAKFFEQLLNLAAEGFYADPGQDGNRGAISWKMIGYDPRIPGRTTADFDAAVNPDGDE